jgi:hypothetical protein
MLRGNLFLNGILATSLCTFASIACDSNRDRPTGLGRPVPPTTVTVVWPRDGVLVPADSVRLVVVEAEGSVTALELYLSRPTISDTVIKERRVFSVERLTLEEEFSIRIPQFRSGTRLEIRAAVEDVIGFRHLSQPVTVEVIECNQFTIACDGI